ncbi:MAG: formylmethanofuran dehydrogenase [Desulfatibacillum sp.]|nr:formylmethanofuran dehydrogenase [Desulfatibacillum sp.]
MTVEEVLQSNDFKLCLDFHGHLCPGLSTGYQGAKAALAWLKENRSEDEDLVAVVETDACMVDAIQVLTGCTFGKGNLIYKDYGKAAFSLLSRKSGQGVRLSMKPNAFKLPDEHMALIQKRMADAATPEDNKRFWELHHERSYKILEEDAENIFDFAPAAINMPHKARIMQSLPCAACGEATMESKLCESDGKMVCRACLEKA